ncbi:MarR family winged helix-turn-helix transcriptional regulator [Piscinibacter sakaiensis]|uniref:MarR family winged helix-turn-helix transcriptional regulator n=1 Tax=Piscinibacter sakaiensis TaxID=1547922 RepID=UPI003AB0D266
MTDSEEPSDDGANGELGLGPLGDLLGFHLARATLTTTALFERHIGKPFGLSKVEFSMLMLLLANGPLNPKRLAHALALTPPKMTMLLDRMQARELLRRERSEIDRRSQNVVLTAEGERIARGSAAAAPASEAALNGRLSRAERAMLLELLDKVAGG